MRAIRLSGSEGGVALTTPSLPLSPEQPCSFYLCKRASLAYKARAPTNHGA